MKYVVKVRRTVVQETFVEVEADNPVSAMDNAEDKYFFIASLPTTQEGVSTTQTEWVAVSVNEKEG